jgi:hypothetical protein
VCGYRPKHGFQPPHVGYRVADWDEVAREEESCRALILALKRAHTQPAQRPSAAARTALMRAMLADDAEVRDLAEPGFWCRRCSAWGESPVTRR